MYVRKRYMFTTAKNQGWVLMSDSEGRANLVENQAAPKGPRGVQNAPLKAWGPGAPTGPLL